MSQESFARDHTVLHQLLRMQLLLRLLPCFFSASFSHFVSGFLPVLCSWPWGCCSSLLRRVWWVLHPLLCSLGLMTGLAHQFPGTLSFQSLFPHLWFISQGNIKPCKIKNCSEIKNNCGPHFIFSISFFTTWFSGSQDPVRGQAPSGFLPSCPH